MFVGIDSIKPVSPELLAQLEADVKRYRQAAQDVENLNNEVYRANLDDKWKEPDATMKKKKYIGLTAGLVSAGAAVALLATAFFPDARETIPQLQNFLYAGLMAGPAYVFGKGVKAIICGSAESIQYSRESKLSYEEEIMIQQNPVYVAKRQAAISVYPPE